MASGGIYGNYVPCTAPVGFVKLSKQLVVVTVVALQYSQVYQHQQLWLLDLLLCSHRIS